MDVLFVTAGNRDQASSRLRVYELIPFLRDRGINGKTIPTPKHSNNIVETAKKILFIYKIVKNSKKFDVIYVQKVRFPKWFTMLLNLLYRSIIFDYDDAIYKAPPGNSVDEKNVKYLNYLIDVSDLVVAGNPILSEYAEKRGADTVVVSTGIPREKYRSARRMTSPDDEFILGWIGNPENLHYLEDIEQPVTRILEANDSVKLRIITDLGSEVYPFESRVRNDVEYIQWEREKSIEDLAECHLTLRPLRDDEWTRAKGGFTSIIESLALGIPVIASPVGMIQDLIENGVNGWLAQSEADWETILNIVVTDPSKVALMKDSALQTVSEHGFWSENKAEEVAEILGDLTENGE